MSENDQAPQSLVKVGSILESSSDNFLATYLVVKQFDDLNSMVKYVNKCKLVQVDFSQFRHPRMFPVFMIKDFGHPNIYFITHNHSYFKNLEVTNS